MKKRTLRIKKKRILTLSLISVNSRRVNQEGELGVLVGQRGGERCDKEVVNVEA